MQRQEQDSRLDGSSTSYLEENTCSRPYTHLTFIHITNPEAIRDPSKVQTARVHAVTAAWARNRLEAQKDGSNFRLETFAGCFACKRQGVKCDEAKPKCKGCVNGNVICNYVLRKAWLVDPMPQFAWPPWNRDSDEQRSFLYFRQRTAKYFTWESPTSYKFFHEFLPQVASSEPIIWNIVIAMAAKQEQFSVASDIESVKCKALALRHHAKALSTLTHSLRSISVDVVLLSSLLLTGYCNLEEGSLETGLMHFTFGLDISEEENASDSRSRNVFLRSFTESMTAELALMVVACSAPSEDVAILAPLEEYCPTLPEAFHNLLQAKDTLFEIIRWRFYIPVRELLSVRRQRAIDDAQNLLIRWYALVQRLKHLLEAQGSSNAHAAAAMLFQFKLFAMGFNESGDALLRQFRAQTLSVDLSTSASVSILFMVEGGRFENLVNTSETHFNELNIWPCPTAYRVDDEKDVVVVKFRR